MVVRGGGDITARREVVLVSDGDPGRRAADLAFSLAAELGVAVRAVSVKRPPLAFGDYWLDPRDSASQDAARLAVTLDAAHNAYPDVLTIVTAVDAGIGDAPSVLSHDARLVVVAAQPSDTGTEIRTLVHGASCPVAVVPVG
jgi:hypothetical protein